MSAPKLAAYELVRLPRPAEGAEHEGPDQNVPQDKWYLTDE
jgi:hypothetical protein